MTRARSLLRVVWIFAGLLFLVWQFRSFQAQGVDFDRIHQTPEIYISEDGPALEVMPIAASQSVGLIFYPGGMVEPRAYLPLAHALAQRDYPVVIVKLPYRSALLEEQERSVHDYVRATINDSILERWVVGGHSRGGALAARFVHQYPDVADALLLLGTTHPKAATYSLADHTTPVTKIYATLDGIAKMEAVLSNRSLLPPTATFIPIEGGNHSQFGYYGNQLGDHRASISRAEQQRQVVDAIVAVLAQLRRS